MEQKSSNPQQLIEQIFYGQIDNDQVAIYRTKIGGEWVYNLTAKDLREYNAIDTKSYQAFDIRFYDLKSYERIQTSETWFNCFDDVLDKLKDLHWPLVYEIHIHPEFRERFAQEVEFSLQVIQGTWDRVCCPDGTHLSNENERT